MARPLKQGIDYFPLDVDLDQDDKLQMIIGEFGFKGEVIFIKLLAWIYKHNGYYVEWNEMEQLKFAKRVSYIGDSSVNLVNNIIARCIKWGIFDNDLYESSQILSSNRIQKTWLDASRKRKDRVIDANIWLLGVIDGLKAEETHKKAEIIHKGKESKRNEMEIKGKENLFGSYPTHEINLDLPDIHVKSAIEAVKFTKNILLTSEKIKGLWPVFKTQNLNGEKYYKSENDIFSHFLNWIKSQKFLNGNTAGNNEKSAAGKQLITSTGFGKL